ncbi:NADH:flavin oxidoreductase/NADH oxidase [Dichomitus squalens]|nr:NADH:flavin oxidoreductase/NADH oxidase [Dichomitus squalens]
MSPSTPALFQPIRIGDVELSHRVVLAPLTRLRATREAILSPLAVEYYRQRASVPGTLLITEATYISRNAGGMAHAPGIYTDEQIAAWKGVVDAVHAQGSYIYLQIWALGRMARPASIGFQAETDIPYVAPSPIPLPNTPDIVPRELTKEEIKEYVEWFAQAADNAVSRARFDGVEVHGANGYLVDQFLKDTTNFRTDEYGGSIPNRARFALEVIDAISTKIGQSKTAIRLSPWGKGRTGELRMDDPVPTFTYLVDQFKQKYPNLAYLHVVSPDAPFNVGPEDKSQNDFIYKLWRPRPVITTGGYDRESGLRVAQETGQLIGYGRAFLANPDLPFRLREDISLNEIEEDTLYSIEAEQGYTTYPFSQAFLKSAKL